MTRAGHRNKYKAGDWLADCARCGFTYYASELQKEWTGHRVCKVCFEPPHPQDSIKVRGEKGIPWSQPPVDVTIDVPGWTETVVDGTAQTVTFGPVDPDSL